MGILALSGNLFYINKIFKLDFLKILLWADLDLLESISIYIFVNENQKNLPGSIFLLMQVQAPCEFEMDGYVDDLEETPAFTWGGGGGDYYSFATVSSLH